MATVLPSTCSACRSYDAGGTCTGARSLLRGQRVWSLACVPCNGYERSQVPATPVDLAALAAVKAGRR